MGTARVPGGPVGKTEPPRHHAGATNYIRLSGSTRRRLTTQPHGAIVVPRENQ